MFTALFTTLYEFSFLGKVCPTHSQLGFFSFILQDFAVFKGIPLNMYLSNRHFDLRFATV